jgi:hypothetical protein
MEMRRAISMVTKNRNGILETLNLIGGQWLARGIVGSSQMSHDSVDAHVAELDQAGNELVQLIETNSQTAHACIDFDVHIDYDSGVRGGLVQGLNHVKTINH